MGKTEPTTVATVVPQNTIYIHIYIVVVGNR